MFEKSQLHYSIATTALTETARKALAETEKHLHIQLSARDCEQFLKMLDANTEPNGNLTRAADRHRNRIV